MKKLLSILLALMLVFTISASIVLADETATDTTATETTETDTSSTDAAAPSSMPADFDEKSIVQYFILDVTDSEVATVDILVTATDGTLDYYADLYAAYGQALEETTYEGKRALSMGSSEVKKEELADAGIAYITKSGFFKTNEMYVYLGGSMSSSGYTEGEKLMTVVFKDDDKSESFDVIVGEQNTFVYTNTQIKWINVLIVVMCIVVLALIALTVVIAVKNKKKAAKENSLKDKEFVSENEVFDKLVEEAGVELKDEAEVIEELEDEEVDEAEEAVEDEEDK